MQAKDILNVSIIEHILQRYIQHCFTLPDRFFHVNRVCNVCISRKLVAHSYLQPFVPDPVLKERLEPETAENIGLIESKETFQKTYVKVKTRL